MGRLVDAVLPERLGTGYRWLLASSWTTNLGDGISLAAGPLLVASLTRDAFLVSLAALLRWAPPMLFGLYAGALSDRLDRRRIVIVANVARAAVLAVLVTAVVTGSGSVAVALVVLGVLSTAEVFADNTSATLAPMLVRRDDLALANARLQTGFITLNQLIGPAAGAALFAAGRAWPFVTETVLVVAGVLLVARVTVPPLRDPVDGDPVDGDPERAAGGLARDVLEGLRWTARHRAVRTLVLTILLFNFTFGAAWSVLVLYANRRLGLGPVGFGLVTTAQAAGGLLGTAVYGRLTRRVSLGNVMRAGLIIETFTHLGLALTTSPFIALPIFVIFGAHAFIWGTTSITVRQRAVPAFMQGRVNSVNTLGIYSGLVIGAAIGGVLATNAGVTAPFWFAFAGSALLVVLLWRELAHIAHTDATP